jgi:hypothetical protein
MKEEIKEVVDLLPWKRSGGSRRRMAGSSTPTTPRHRRLAKPKMEVKE